MPAERGAEPGAEPGTVADSAPPAPTAEPHGPVDAAAPRVAALADAVAAAGPIEDIAPAPGLTRDAIVVTAAQINSDFGQRLAFLLEIDQLKTVIRRSLLTDGSRAENTAEHSWHLAMFAVLLADYSAESVDVGRAVMMTLVHDLVEIDADDTFVYDTAANATKAERERIAADRIFALAPEPLGTQLRALWEEFEARITPEARFAAACDRLAPIMLNVASGGRNWQRYGIAEHQVRALNQPLGDVIPEAWTLIDRLIGVAVESGALASE